MAAMVRSLLSALAVALGSAAASLEGTECLLWQGQGCQSITAEAECLSRRDGRPEGGQNGWLIAGQPCSWCGGERCTDSGDALCLPHDWVKQRANISTANCSTNETRKAPLAGEEVAASTSGSGDSTSLVFEKPAHGAMCSAAHLDASTRVNKYYFTYSAATAHECRAICVAQGNCTGFGFENANQTCKAWWLPIESTVPSSDAADQCAKAIIESGAQQRTGEEQVMSQMEVDPQRNATGQELEASLGASDPESVTFTNLTEVSLIASEIMHCLLWQGQGCESITDEAECLSSRDGRPWAQRHGLLISGQPCSWCGGEKCENGSDAMCMPNDWVKQRAGVSTANCSNHTYQARENGDSCCGATCSATPQNASEHADKYYFTYSADTADQCREICAAQDNCTGFGFEANETLCKAWWYPIEFTLETPDSRDQCNKTLAEQPVGYQQEAMRQMEDDPRRSATGQELAVQDGLTDQQKGAIAGGVVGGVAAAGLLGGLLGGLLPHGAATVTTTLADQMFRMMTDNESVENFTNDTANDSLVLLGDAAASQAGAASWIWWALAAAAALALAALGACCFLSSDSGRSCRGIEDFDSDEESVSATPRLEAAPQRPVLLARAPQGAAYKQLAIGSVGVEPVAMQPAPVHSLGMEPMQAHMQGTGAAATVRGLGASGSVRSLWRHEPREPVATWGRGAGAPVPHGMPVSIQPHAAEPGRHAQTEPLGNIR